MILCLFLNFLFFFKEYDINGFFFFFSSRRRHTRSTRDWSSDVCSSDLLPRPSPPPLPEPSPAPWREQGEARAALAAAAAALRDPVADAADALSLLRLAVPPLAPRADEALAACETALD